MPTLEIRNLHTSVETTDGVKPILHGVNLSIGDSEVHAIISSNGSGKSTMAYALVGHPKYRITEGQIFLDGEETIDMTSNERAQAGLFLATQYPIEVLGVPVTNLLRTAKMAVDGEAPKLREWTKRVREATGALKVSSDFVKRDLNVGFSGDEKRRTEVLRMELLEPKVAILDETDSDLDVDALRAVSGGVNRVRERTGNSILLITHYSRIPRYVKPDFVHVFVEGKIVSIGGPELADKLEERGYDEYIEV